MVGLTEACTLLVYVADRLGDKEFEAVCKMVAIVSSRSRMNGM